MSTLATYVDEPSSGHAIHIIKEYVTALHNYMHGPSWTRTGIDKRESLRQELDHAQDWLNAKGANAFQDTEPRAERAPTHFKVQHYDRETRRRIRFAAKFPGLTRTSRSV